jgi:hypothetical protein
LDGGHGPPYNFRFFLLKICSIVPIRVIGA